MKQRLYRSIVLIVCLAGVGTVLMLLWPSSQGAVFRIDASQAVFSPTDQRLALITGHGVQIWDGANKTLETLTDSPKADIVPGGPIPPLAWHPSGAYLALPGDHFEVAVWDVQQRQQLTSLAGATNRPDSLAFSPDGALLASVDLDGTLSVWRWAQKTLLWQNQYNGNDILVFNTDGSQIITGDKVYNTLDGSVRLNYRDIRTVFFKCIAADPPRGLIADCNSLGEVHIINLTQHNIQDSYQALDGAAKSAAFSYDGRRLAVGAGTFEAASIPSTAIKIFDVQTKQVLWSLPLRQIVHVDRLQFSFDNRQLVAVVQDAPFLVLSRGSVYVWDLSSL